jgi:8-oxo-dGTP pyrophosphatase MutT (NUDIX family)
MRSQANGEHGEKRMNSETQRIVSSGGVIFRVVDRQFKVALISRGKVWCLPKGLIEQGETAEETALREVKEETGLEGKIIEKIGEINYHFFRGKRCFKNVHFFLLEYVAGSVSDHDYEADKVKWFSTSKALQVLTYVNERRILRKAEEMLKQKSNRWVE